MCSGEGFPEHIHNLFSPYMVLATPYMVKMSCEYVQETPLDTPLDVPVSGPQTRRIVSIVHISDSYHGSC